MTKELSNCLYIRWRWQLGNKFNFCLVNFYSPARDNVSQYNSLVDHKMALLPVEHQVLLYASLQDGFQINQTFFKIATIYNDVIHVYFHYALHHVAEQSSDVPTEELFYDAEEVKYLGEPRSYHFKPNPNLPAHYHPALRNHENFSYGRGTSQGPRHGQNPQQGYQQPQRFLQQQQGGENRNEYQNKRRAQPFEDQMLQFMGDNKKLLNLYEQKFAELEASNTNSQFFQKTTNASLKNLETQIGQLALNLQNHMKDAFPSDTKKNPKDCMAVQLRSGKDLEKKNEKDVSNKGEEGPEIAETLEGKRKKEQLSREGSKKKT